MGLLDSAKSAASSAVDSAESSAKSVVGGAVTSAVNAVADKAKVVTDAINKLIPSNVKVINLSTNTILKNRLGQSGGTLLNSALQNTLDPANASTIDSLLNSDLANDVKKVLVDDTKNKLVTWAVGGAGLYLLKKFLF